MKKTIGIIGGMGPMATIDLYKKIVDLTPAHSDKEHLHLIIDNNTSIPDRTESILGYGEGAIFELVRSAIKLEDMGADLLIMPCNTAHFYYEDIKKYISIPFINMVEETVKEIKSRGIDKVGILATDGTIKSGVYSRMCEKYGIEYIIPDELGQREVMKIIYHGVKAGDFTIDIEGFKRVIRDLEVLGTKVLVLGCTELPIAFQRFSIESEVIDPAFILAKVAVEEAYRDENLWSMIEVKV